MNEKFAALKQRLQELTFAKVSHSVAKDENLISFRDKNGFTVWDDDPDFEAHHREFNPAEWRNADRSYSFYYGFAQTKSGGIHFDSKGHVYQNEGYSGLRVFTKQETLNPPVDGWIVGIVVNPERPHFYRWVRCTESEKLFVEFMLGGKTRFSDDDRRRLCVSRHISLGKSSNRLVRMAMLLLARDLDYFIDHRMRHGAGIDPDVYEICEEYAPELWEEYKERALGQNLDPKLKYSELIPAPAPKVIVELRAESSDPQPVGINMPFANLAIK